MAVRMIEMDRGPRRRPIPGGPVANVLRAGTLITIPAGERA